MLPMGSNGYSKLDAERALYKQEGRAGLYQVMLPYLTSTTLMQKYVSGSWGEGVGHCKTNFFTGVFYEENMAQVARNVLESAKRGDVEQWLEKWHRIDTALTETSYALATIDMSSLSLSELRSRYDALYALHLDMWAISIFIDVFDVGYDQCEIERIAAAHSLTPDEVHILTTPAEPSFVSVWEDLLLRFSRGEKSFQDIHRRFFWNGTTYSESREVDEQYLREESVKVHSQPPAPGDEAMVAVLSRHGLKTNPLDFFRTLTLWRDERKRLNYTGLYGLIKILREVATRNGMSATYLNALLPRQVDDFFAGKLPESVLKRQFDEDFCLGINADGTFDYYFGEEAAQIWDTVQTVLSAGDDSTQDTLKGVVASRGSAKGRARIIKDFNDPRAASFAEGDILVTSMTRPEFLPLMKLAAAFVTNEGGITSHAAIVAREMKKPCIIGTKVATQVLKDGDLVEVDAEKGVVRVIG